MTAELEEVQRRLALLVEGGKKLEAEGLPFPSESIAKAAGEALTRGEVKQAFVVVRRGESLYARSRQDWNWLRELLRRADELRAQASLIGVDVQLLDARVGNPRAALSAGGLSSGALEKAAARASLALAVLNDLIPKFCIQEARNFGEAIRRAKNRGEDTQEASSEFAEFLQSARHLDVPQLTTRFQALRQAVGRIPMAPVVPTLSADEEADILLEARNLARRLSRIKGRARDAKSAAKLMAQVRAALSEDRRFGSPEEEIEALWSEVDRLTKERSEAAGLNDRPTDADDESGSDTEESGFGEAGLVPPLPGAGSRGNRRVSPPREPPAR